MAVWTFGELKSGGIRICSNCGEVTLEDEMHACTKSKQGEGIMNDYGFKDEDWRSINARVLQLANDPTVSRLDLKINDVTVLLYKAGTVIRVDFKGML